MHEAWLECTWASPRPAPDTPASGGPTRRLGVDAHPALTGRALGLARSSGPRTLRSTLLGRPRVVETRTMSVAKSTGVEWLRGVPAIRRTAPLRSPARKGR